MYSTSGDLLNYVLAFSALWLVVLISWLLWYAISVVRTIKNAIDDVTDRVRMFDELLHLIREKLEPTSTYMGLLVDIIKEGLHWFRERESGATYQKPLKSRKK